MASAERRLLNLSQSIYAVGAGTLRVLRNNCIATKLDVRQDQSSWNLVYFEVQHHPVETMVDGLSLVSLA